MVAALRVGGCSGEGEWWRWWDGWAGPRCRRRTTVLGAGAEEHFDETQGLIQGGTIPLRTCFATS